jgi:hypothetical protein
MCKNGEHNLIEILRVNNNAPDEETVVRWCQDCGAVVVDIDYDNRTFAGRITPMKFPKYLKEK